MYTKYYSGSTPQMYYNNYEKKAERIREEARKRTDMPIKKEVIPVREAFGGFKTDDLLLGLIILFLIKEEKADLTLIMALVFILLH